MARFNVLYYAEALAPTCPQNSLSIKTEERSSSSAQIVLVLSKSTYSAFARANKTALKKKNGNDL